MYERKGLVTDAIQKNVINGCNERKAGGVNKVVVPILLNQAAQQVYNLKGGVYNAPLFSYWILSGFRVEGLLFYQVNTTQYFSFFYQLYGISTGL
jgi:hypothetical protein